MTSTLKLKATISNPKSNSYGYAGDPVTVNLTNEGTFIREELSNTARNIDWPILPSERGLKRPRNYVYPLKQMTGKILIRGYLSSDAALSGTHTGDDASSFLVDSTADFLEDGVCVGMIVFNLDDLSSAVITNVAPTAIAGTLIGGSNNDWDKDDRYTIFANSAVQKKNKILAMCESGELVTLTWRSQTWDNDFKSDTDTPTEANPEMTGMFVLDAAFEDTLARDPDDAVEGVEAVLTFNLTLQKVWRLFEHDL